MSRHQAHAWWAVGYLIASAATCALVLTRPATDRLADLAVYRGAAVTVRAGGSLYDFHAANGDAFTYPPFAVLTMLPLAWLPSPATDIAWTVASLTALALMGHLVATRSRSEGVALPGGGWALACALLVSAPGQSDIRFGQISGLVVLVALADALGVLPRRWQGLGVGLAAAVKLTPLLFVVHLFLTGRRTEAARAVAAFVAATAAAWLVLPSDSSAFWLSEVGRTDRIGDLASLGNQSVNGVLFRAGLTGSLRPAVWAAAVVALSVLSLARARTLHLSGRTIPAAVLVGCATVAASPVSWTHHQLWTVLAAMLLVAAPQGSTRATGAVLLAGLTLSVTDLVARLPIGGQAVFLAANARGLAVVAVCIAGFAARPRPQREPAIARPYHLVRVRWATVAIGAVLFAVLPLPGGADPAAHNLSSATALEHATGGQPLCGVPDSSPGSPLSGSGQCAEAPLYPDLPFNYSQGRLDDGTTEITGFASLTVARVDYLPSPGRPPVGVVLRRFGGVQVFAVVVSDCTYAQLRVYDTQGHYLGDYGDKLHDQAWHL